MKEPCDNVIYGGHEKFVWVVVLCWEDGLWIWLFMRYILLKLFLNMCMSWGVFCVFAKAKQMAYNLTRSMFWNLVSCFANCMLFI